MTTTEPAAKAAAKAKKPPASEYVVLQRSLAGLPDNVSETSPSSTNVTAWIERGRVSAPSARDAIRQVADGTPGTYLAVPARSYQPTVVRVETQTVLKLETA